MFRFSHTDKPFLPIDRFGALFAVALAAAFATTSVYANETEKSRCPSSQPTTGSRIPTANCDRDEDKVQVLDPIMVGAVLEPGDTVEADANDATPELPMMRAEDENAVDGARR